MRAYAPGSYDDFSIRMDTTVIGIRSGQVSLTNNDGDESFFNFEVLGVVPDPLAPEIEVKCGDVDLMDGDSSPSTREGTEFGSLALNESWPTRTWRVSNSGIGPLTTSDLQVPHGFVIAEPLNASIAPGSYDDFSVQMDTSIAGVKSGQVSFFTNDIGEDPFNFHVTGVVADPLATVIEVKCGDIKVADGDDLPNLNKGTEFGSLLLNDVWPTRSWRIYNRGSETLSVGNLQVPDGFTVWDPLIASIAPGSYDDFSVRMNTTVAGMKSGEVSFVFNGGDDNPFSFDITGTVYESFTPEVEVKFSRVLVMNGDSSPSASEGTDFRSHALHDSWPTPHVARLQHRYRNIGNQQPSGSQPVHYLGSTGCHYCTRLVR